VKRLLPLMVGAVALGLDAYVIAGILPLISHDLAVSVSTLGLMVTAFTLAYGLLSPLLSTVATGRSMRTVLVVALVVFTAGNAVTALSSDVALLMISRVVAGAGAGLYMPMAVAAAAQLVPAELRGRALALVTGGMTVGVVIGVPIGLTLSGHAGWRAAPWLAAGLGAIALAGVITMLPPLAGASGPTLRERGQVLADRRVLTVALATGLSSAASIGAYTYLSELLTALFHPHGDTGYLWLWGVGGIVGSFGVGAVVDRFHRTKDLTTLIFTAIGVAILAVATIGHAPVVAGVFLVVWGVFGWSSLTPQQHRMLALRPDAGTVAVALNSSAMYLGISLGAALGSVFLAAGWTPIQLAYAFVVLALAAAAVNAVLTPPDPAPAEPAAPAADSGRTEVRHG
jgi:predicted MFS family arabinose efflux permease